jgi:sortase A
VIRSLQIALVVLGVACLGWVAVTGAERARYHADVVKSLSTPTLPVETTAAVATAALPFQGLLEIPRIGLSEAFADGDDDATLRKAIGHLPDTPFPWNPGNSAFAGHRDTEFRPLRHVRVGDEVRLTTPRGVFTYHVSRTMIVNPDDVWVLAPTTSARELTLVTCYPFTYIGHAPNRFVVKAVADPAGENP